MRLESEVMANVSQTRFNASANTSSVKSGVYDISIEEYHASEGISRSDIMQLKRSPLHYFSRKLIKRTEPDSPALVFGNAVHTYILERDTFNNKYFVAPKPNRTTTVGKKQWEEIQKESAGRIILFDDMFAEVQRVATAFFNEPRASKLIEGAKFEKSIYWTDEATGLLCKARPDIWHTHMVCDLKTSSDASLPEFSRSMANYGYHIQAAMIKDGLKAVCNQDMNDFLFIVVEKVEPFAIGVYFMDPAAIQKGQEEYRFLLKGLKKYLDYTSEKSEQWPGYKTAVASLPAYYVSAV